MWKLLLDPSHAPDMRARSPGSEAREPLAGPSGAGAVESIDFDLYESQEQVALKASVRQKLLRSLLRWCAVALTGVATGCVASGIDYGIAQLTLLRFALLRGLLGGPVSWLLLAQLASCSLLAALAAAPVCFVSPLAAGSGIPEVKCRLNGLDLPLVVQPRTLLAKAIGVLFSVSAGLPCGKEGPMIHSGSILGALLARFTTQPPFWAMKELSERDLIAAGGAAGVAAAFGAPVGGVLFALEEGASFWSPTLLLQCLLASTLAALTLNFFLGGLDQMGFGTLGALGALTFGSYFESNASSYHLWELPFFLCLAIVGGLVGAAFNALNIPLTMWRMRLIGPAGWWRFLEVLLVSSAISLLFISPAAMLEACLVTDVKPKHDAFMLTCSPSSKSPLEPALGLFMTPSEDAIKLLFHDPEAFDLGLLSLFTGLYFLMACWTYGLGVPSGLFVPSLLTGAALGRLLGELLKPWGAVPGMYALVGAAASLAGMARITVSLAMILVEATGNTQYSIPILLTTILAKAIGDLFNQGIYDIHIHLKKLPLLEASSEVPIINEPISSLMTEDVESLGAEEPPARIAQLLATGHHGFPLVSASGSYLGMVNRQGLENQELSVNHGAFSVFEDVTVRRAYDLFRTMGLRHLPVVDRSNRLRGIVTRKDFLRA